MSPTITEYSKTASVILILKRRWLFHALTLNHTAACCTHGWSKMQLCAAGACPLNKAVWVKVMGCERVIELAGLVTIRVPAHWMKGVNGLQRYMYTNAKDRQAVEIKPLYPGPSPTVCLPMDLVRTDQFSTFSWHHCLHQYLLLHTHCREILLKICSRKQLYSNQ